MDLFADGRFEIHRARILGSGAFGIVFPGYDHVTQQEVAIKEIDLEAIRLDASLSPEQKERSLASVEKEMAICLHLKHPHIVECIYVNKQDHLIYIVMELIRGPSLSTFLEGQRLPPVLCHKFFYELLMALHYLHGRSICHRDLKPENLLLTSTDLSQASIKVIDFGLSFAGERMMTSPVGTLQWAAPEVLRAEKYSYGVDIYSAALVFYSLLLGKHPIPDTVDGLDVLDMIRAQAIPIRPELPFLASGVVESLISHDSSAWDRHNIYQHPGFQLAANFFASPFCTTWTTRVLLCSPSDTGMYSLVCFSNQSLEEVALQVAELSGVPAASLTLLMTDCGELLSDLSQLRSSELVALVSHPCQLRTSAPPPPTRKPCASGTVAHSRHLVVAAVNENAMLTHLLASINSLEKAVEGLLIRLRLSRRCRPSYCKPSVEINLNHHGDGLIQKLALHSSHTLQALLKAWAPITAQDPTTTRTEKFESKFLPLKAKYAHWNSVARARAMKISRLLEKLVQDWIVLQKSA